MEGTEANSIIHSRKDFNLSQEYVPALDSDYMHKNACNYISESDVHNSINDYRDCENVIYCTENRDISREDDVEVNIATLNKSDIDVYENICDVDKVDHLEMHLVNAVDEDGLSSDKDSYTNRSDVNENFIAPESACADNTAILNDNFLSVESHPVDTDKLSEISPYSASSSPQSYRKELDSAQNIDENQACSSSRKKCTMPYFQLPNPDLEDFLVETDKKFQIPQMEESECNSHKPSKEKEMFLCDTAPSNAYNKLKTKKTFQSLNYSVSPSEVICLDIDYGDVAKSKPLIKMQRNSFCSQYNKVISSLTQLDESKSPGIKRLVLKEYLRKVIDEKKFVAFNRSKENLKLENEEMESEVCEESETEENFLSSDDNLEETVSLDKHVNGSSPEGLDNEDNSLNNESYILHTELEELDNENNVLSLSDSDDDTLHVKKKKKAQIIEDSSDDSNSLPDLDFHNSGEIDKIQRNFIIPQVPIYAKQSENALDFENNCSVKESEFTPELNIASESVNVNAEFHYQNSSSLMDPKNIEEGFFQIGSSQICSSIPSYQPGGGFLNQKSEENSCDSEIIGSEINSSNYDKNLCDTDFEFLKTFSHVRSSTFVSPPKNIPDEADNSFNGSISALRLPLDDLPVSNVGNISDMFLSQDLADVCSGAFKSDTCTFEKEEEVEDVEKSSVKDAASDDLSDLDELPQEKVNDFFDNEAELSGEDDGIDDDDDDPEGDNGTLCVSDTEVPHEEECREKITDLYMKHLHDDHDVMVKELKEKFLDDGELNNDGAGRLRKFAWKDNDMMNIGADEGDRESSSESDSEIDSSWSVNQEKAKWQQENKKEYFEEELEPSYKRTSLKVDIIGKPKFSLDIDDSSKHLSFKRPRGSFLHLDTNSACQVLKKLKTSEDDNDGSRTTRHFVFRNDLTEDAVTAKEVPLDLIPKNPKITNDHHAYGSIFNKI